MSSKMFLYAVYNDLPIVVTENRYCNLKILRWESTLLRRQYKKLPPLLKCFIIHSAETVFRFLKQNSTFIDKAIPKFWMVHYINDLFWNCSNMLDFLRESFRSHFNNARSNLTQKVSIRVYTISNPSLWINENLPTGIVRSVAAQNQWGANGIEKP